jgi:hypothetical protein
MRGNHLGSILRVRSQILRWSIVINYLILTIKTLSLRDRRLGHLTLIRSLRELIALRFLGEVLSKCLPCISSLIHLAGTVSRVVFKHQIPLIFLGSAVLFGWGNHCSGMLQMNFSRNFWMCWFDLSIHGARSLFSEGFLLVDGGHRTRFETSTNFLWRRLLDTCMAISYIS